MVYFNINNNSNPQKGRKYNSPYKSSKQARMRQIKNKQSDLMERISKLVNGNKNSQLRKVKLPYRKYSNTPFFANREQRKVLRHNKNRLLNPYQYNAENESSHIYNWNGNLIKAGCLGRQNYNTSKRARSTFQRSSKQMGGTNRSIRKQYDGNYDTNQTNWSPVKQKQSQLFRSTMSKTTRHTYEPDYIQEFLVKDPDTQNNFNKCDGVHARLGFFLKKLAEQKQEKKFLQTHIKNLQVTTHREGVKTDKIKGKCRVLERKIAHTNHLIMLEQEHGLNINKEKQKIYEHAYELNQDITDLKQQIADTKQFIKENEQAVNFLQSEKLQLQINLRHEKEMKEEDKRDVKVRMKKLGLNMQRYNIRADHKTIFKHELAKADKKNPEGGWQLQDYSDLFHNLHCDR